MSVALKKTTFEGISTAELTQQIASKKKCATKLPTYYRTPKIYYPHPLQLAQTSSEITAHYKASLVRGKSLLDLSGGLGVDSYYFAKKVGCVWHCEIDEILSQIAHYNFVQLGADNIRTYTGNGLDFLKQTKEKFDWIYIDPSRRNEQKNRVFMLADCTPNILEHLDSIFEKTACILVKTAPLLDLSQGISELRFVSCIHVVAVQNDVKELLWILKKDASASVRIKTINHTSTEVSTFDFLRSDEFVAVPDFALPMQFLYEPNAAILKSGAFKTIGVHFHLKKLHEHSHLYTADHQISFPGRVFHIREVIPYSKKNLLKFKGKQAHITVRNFPESVAVLRKKLSISDGGTTYLFFTKNCEGKRIVLVCSKTKVQD
ncbi:class I SAM-dependent methyltransferase [Arenibacter sp. GZD96]|uniref:class I SAM-dependent methyltransferase n=1 Tax=Aurantibrevibacter litoralis TaxID=3106030 RepID=UPI002AFEAEE8|nr:class I SAM-dependent methyltransferase [Arenibacter sp. GZD-96]MEA1787412.1 class I SAM-dependent methyltransferase [Arenibacter sp. GZD-96]